ncbi:MAG: putative lipid II flippase FtsW [Actinomycetia bacterium]|nr:putative lipid II flippase FtsW [Actinomycetes bacterium]MCP4084252.1 putative lipid II flippase FtsW [Actinomycetes bacterium]
MTPSISERVGALRTKTTAAGATSQTILLAVVVLLNVLGLVMVLSASSFTAQHEFGSPWYVFRRQVMWAGVGFGALLACRAIDYRVWRRLATPLIVVSSITCVGVLIPAIGTEVNGSRRWITAGSFSFQPSELAKFAVLVFVADLLARRARHMSNPRLTYRPVLVVLSLVALPVLLENLGSSVVIVGSTFLVMFVAGAPLARLITTFVVGTALAAPTILWADYRRQRLFAFLDPWSQPLDSGYNIIQSQVGIASGGVSGVGLGASKAKWGFLPEAHSDFIFAVIAEETGLIGAVSVVLLFLVLGVVGVRTALRAPDRFGRLLAAGLISWLIIQAVINTGTAVGTLPVTGEPLPFVSSGGSALVLAMAASGVLINIARQAR